MRLAAAYSLSSLPWLKQGIEQCRKKAPSPSALNASVRWLRSTIAASAFMAAWDALQVATGVRGGWRQNLESLGQTHCHRCQDRQDPHHKSRHQVTDHRKAVGLHAEHLASCHRALSGGKVCGTRTTEGCLKAKSTTHAEGLVSAVTVNSRTDMEVHKPLPRSKVAAAQPAQPGNHRRGYCSFLPSTRKTFLELPSTATPKAP